MVKKLCLVLIGALLLQSVLFSSATGLILYKTSDKVGWIEDIPAEEGLCYASIDSGIEIPTRVVFVSSGSAFYSAEWSWNHAGDVDSFSYRVNGGRWVTVDADTFSAKTSVNVDSLNIFEIYATVGGVNSESMFLGILPLAKEEKENAFSARLSFAPYSIAFYDFYNGHTLENAIYTTNTKYGLSADFDLGYSIKNAVRPYFGISYSLERKGTTVIPNAFNVYYAKALCGLDINLMRKNDFTLSAGPFGGVMMHVNGNKFNISSLLGARVDLSYSFNDTLSVSAGTKISASHLPAAEPLLSSITYLVDPLTFSVGVRF